MKKKIMLTLLSIVLVMGILVSPVLAKDPDKGAQGQPFQELWDAVTQLQGWVASFSVSWNDIVDIPAGFADNVDDVGLPGLQGPPAAQLTVSMGNDGLRPTSLIGFEMDYPIVLLGAGFPPDEEVVITIGDLNYVWTETVADEDGGFVIMEPPLNQLPPEQVDYLILNYLFDGSEPPKTVSVRAWVGAVIEVDPDEMGPKVIDGEIWSIWPVILTIPM